MGLGKTLQVISFIDVLMRNTETHTVLAIVPVSDLSVYSPFYQKIIYLIKLTCSCFLPQGEHTSELADRV